MSEATQQLSDDDAFAEAFGQAVAAVDAVSLTEKKDEQAVPAANDKAAEAGGKEGEGGDAGAPDKAGEAQGSAAEAGGEGKDGGDKPDEGASGDAQPQKPGHPTHVTSDDIASLKEEIKALAKPAPKETEPEPKKEEKKLAEPEPYAYSEDEKKALENYSKEWDEHAKVFEIREKRLVHDLTQQLSHRFTVALDSVLQQIEQGLAPLVQGHVQSAQERHVSAIRGAHKDFDTIKGELPGWIEKQPKYLQETLKKTYDEGTTEDVIELLTVFKKDTGRAQPETPSTPTGNKNAPRKDSVPVEKAADMAPVSSKRTVVQSAGVDTSDYDSAFAEALAAMRN